MSSASSPPRPEASSPRLRRILELVYLVEGVVAARVWQWDGRIAVGVSSAPTVTHAELLRRVELAVAPLREPGEAWELGVLEGDDAAAPKSP